ncbi:hypothetical protein, partial [Endozoicomonas sp. ALB115]
QVAADSSCFPSTEFINLFRLGAVTNIGQPSYYASGTAFRVATSRSQNLATLWIWTFSSGECGKRMVRPREVSFLH